MSEPIDIPAAALIVEVCHDLINRAMRCDDHGEYGGDTRMGDEYRAKEAAIRSLIAERDSLRDQLHTANGQIQSLMNRCALVEGNRDALERLRRESAEQYPHLLRRVETDTAEAIAAYVLRSTDAGPHWLASAIRAGSWRGNGEGK